MKVALKIGGSLSVGKGGPDKKYFSRLLPVLKEVDRQHVLSLGIGGGSLVRRYDDTIDGFELTDEEREKCFIELIRANVRFLSYVMDKEPLFDLDGYEEGEVVVGGVRPGRSTDANIATVAKVMNADLFIKVTDVDGIYDKDPGSHEDARKIDEIGFEELERFGAETEPTSYGVLDPLAMEIISKNEIRTVVVSGKDPENILKVIDGERKGTWIADRKME